METKGIKIYRKILSYVLCIGIAMLGTMAYLTIYMQIPQKIRVTAGKEETIRINLPLSGEIVSLEGDITLPVNLMNPIVVKGSTLDSYQMNLKILGVIPIKQVDIEVIPETYLIPMGVPIGIYVKTDGVLVIGIGEFQNEGGIMQSPAKYVLQNGDYITHINGTKVEEKEEIMQMVEESRGADLVLTIHRGEEILDVKITPSMSSVNSYKIGVWLRDNAQGIGTMTYLETDGDFGALGHGITDVDIGNLLEIEGGSLYDANIISIKKGQVGTPGELSGMIAYTDSHRLGNIQINSTNGIFGTCNTKGSELSHTMEPVEIGLKQEVTKGAATIICTLNGERAEYEILIKEIYADSLNVNRSILIEVTDPELLKQTGGIVQGLSGSPILQNGKLIGAVTHVLVNDPTRGYGIFIENMLETAEGVGK